MFSEPHSMIVGWSLDEIGPLLCQHLNIEYDENWRRSDSMATWQLTVKQWIEGAEILISYGENDWSEIKDGRFLVGVFFDLDNADDLEGVDFVGLRDFNNFAKQNDIELPRANIFFYSSDQTWGWAVDTGEWHEFKKRVQ